MFTYLISAKKTKYLKEKLIINMQPTQMLSLQLRLCVDKSRQLPRISAHCRTGLDFLPPLSEFVEYYPDLNAILSRP